MLHSGHHFLFRNGMPTTETLKLLTTLLLTTCLESHRFQLNMHRSVLARAGLQVAATWPALTRVCIVYPLPKLKTKTRALGKLGDPTRKNTTPKNRNGKRNQCEIVNEHVQQFGKGHVCC
mmetsp:Transcript_15533/g.25434  ORF Transcript_15533/g.25434 Transcript_15533/m.25434 type:complete len:120 (+) Transcript_15533:54-413(+)